MFNLFLALVLSFLTVGAASAQVHVDVSDPNDLSPSLIGGTVADPKDWPASPWVGNCSSTLIGERVLLTAAHCVSNGGTKTFTIGNTRYSATCTHHSSYRSNATADWALCLTTAKIVGVPFERVATSEEASCEVGKKFLWTGYGCQRWGGSLDGKFRTGLVATTKCPSGSDYDVRTRGSVALCSGDSGGGGYAILANGERRVVGVNSRSNTVDTSYVSNTFGTTFRTFAETWAKSKQVTICGIHADAVGCSGATDPDPDPDPQPQPDCKAEMAELTTTLTAHNAAAALLKACVEK